MVPNTHTHRALSLATQSGLLRASDLDAIQVPRVILAPLTAAGLLEKRARGLYSLPNVCFAWTPQGPKDVEIVDYH